MTDDNILDKIKIRIKRIILNMTQKRLFQKKESQNKQFMAISNKFGNQYKTLSAFNVEKFLTPLWKEFNRRIEEKLLPVPPVDFLQVPDIRNSMFFSPNPGKYILDTQLRFIEEKTNSKKLLKKWLEEDLIGKPTLSVLKYLTSHNSIHHLFHILKFLETTKSNIDKFETIVEWGGGYGNLAKIFERMTSAFRTYIIIDTPLFSCLQWLYLSTILGNDRVFLYLKKGENLRQNSINLIPICFIDDLQLKADLFISTWGLSESAKFAQDFVSERNFFGANHLLLAFQKADNLPDAERVGNLAKSRGGIIEKIEFLPGNFYAFL